MVQRGDTLSAIASRLGVSVDSLAAANGLDPAGVLVSGTTLHGAGASAGSADSAAQTAEPAASSGGGGYMVQRGDTLSAIASRLGVSVDSLAAANGLDPAGVLVSGTTLHGAGASASAASSAPNGTVSALSSGSGAQPTGER